MERRVFDDKGNYLYTKPNPEILMPKIKITQKLDYYDAAKMDKEVSKNMERYQKIKTAIITKKIFAKTTKKFKNKKHA